MEERTNEFRLNLRSSSSLTSKMVPYSPYLTDFEREALSTWLRLEELKRVEREEMTKERRNEFEFDAIIFEAVIDLEKRMKTLRSLISPALSTQQREHFNCVVQILTERLGQVQVGLKRREIARHKRISVRAEKLRPTIEMEKRGGAVDLTKGTFVGYDETEMEGFKLENEMLVVSE